MRYKLVLAFVFKIAYCVLISTLGLDVVKGRYDGSEPCFPDLSKGEC